MDKIQSKTVVPGARRAVDKDGNPLFVKKGKKRIPVWDMPEPIYHVRHFKSAGSRCLAESELGIDRDDNKLKLMMSPEQLDKYTDKVPVYRGLDASLARYIRGQHRRSERKTAEGNSALGFIKGLITE